MSALGERLSTVTRERGWTRVGESVARGRVEYVVVELGGSSRGVLQVFETEADAKRDVLARSERYAYQLFAVADVIEHGRDWCLVESREGLPFVDFLASRGVGDFSELDQETRLVLAKSVGTMARKLHELEVERAYGDLLDEGYADRPGFAGRWLTFNGYCAARLEEFAEQVRTLDFADTLRSRLLESIGDLRNELSAFHPRHPPALNHGRLCWANMLVSEDGKEIVGVGRFHRARLLPPEADLARLLWLDELALLDAEVLAFYAGYGAARTMDVQRRERFYRRLAAFETLLSTRERAGMYDDDHLLKLTMP